MERTLKRAYLVVIKVTYDVIEHQSVDISLQSIKTYLHTAHKRQKRSRLIHILEHDLTSVKTVTTKWKPGFRVQHDVTRSVSLRETYQQGRCSHYENILTCTLRRATISNITTTSVTAWNVNAVTVLRANVQVAAFVYI